jgi:hypothetical protein
MGDPGFTSGDDILGIGSATVNSSTSSHFYVLLSKTVFVFVKSCKTQDTGYVV